MSDSEIDSVKNGVSKSECKSVDGAAVRNVQTQHGDYRTVDEENIVILPLARCHSPEPPVNESGEIEAVVWIEPFSEENQVSDLPDRRFSIFTKEFAIIGLTRLGHHNCHTNC